MPDHCLLVAQTSESAVSPNSVRQPDYQPGATNITIRLTIMMRAIIILISLAISLHPCPATECPTTNDLPRVRSFAFGGVGFAGIPSEGELAFRAVLAGTNPLPYFKAIFTNGTVEAKLYALCAIRLLSPHEFDKYASAILSSNAVVRTMSGCIGLEEPVADVLGRIKRGSYDRYFGRPSESHPHKNRSLRHRDSHFVVPCRI
jgi:hypothetical protein